ncbi:M48 family metalloprotease [Shigella flexneri]
MSPDEAKAVIAHEIGHIANGDMVTMTLIQGVVNTFRYLYFRILAQLARVLWAEIVDEGEEQRQPADLLCGCNGSGMVFGIVASIITMWFSRRREFHADAGSAKLVVARK